MRKNVKSKRKKKIRREMRRKKRRRRKMIKRKKQILLLMKRVMKLVWIPRQILSDLVDVGDSFKDLEREQTMCLESCT